MATFRVRSSFPALPPLPLVLLLLGMGPEGAHAQGCNLILNPVTGLFDCVSPSGGGGGGRGASATATFALGATSGTLTHNFGSATHQPPFCVETVAGLPVIPSSITLGTNADTINFTGGLAAETKCYTTTGGTGATTIEVQDNGGAAIGNASKLRLATGTGMSWVLADLGGGVVRATPNVDTAGLVTLTGVQTITDKTLGSGTVFTHASQHKNGGSDEVATATPGANAIPKADSGGKLASGWLPAIAVNSSLGNMADAAVNASATNYFGSPSQATFSGTEGLRQVAVAACTNFKMWLRTTGTQSSTGSMVLTVRVDGVDTAIATTIAANQAAGPVSMSGTLSASDGSLISIKAVNNASVNSAGIRGWGWVCY